MIRILLFLVVVFGLGLGFAWLADRPGEMVVTFNGYQYQVSLMVAAVAVEREVRLERIWCAADCGCVINPDGARNQLEGGIVHAASMALKEQVMLGGAGVSSLSWAEYPILRFSEIPEIDVDLLGVPDDPPLGLGEATMGPTAAAIGNAVAHALGARVRGMPMTRARIEASLLA